MFKKRINILLLSILTMVLFISINVDAETTNKRLFGADRYKTSLAVSEEGWQISDYVVLVNGENFPDGLSASVLAKSRNAPILLSGKDSLDSDVKDKISSLKVKYAVLVGGTGVLSLAIEDQLRAMKIMPIRLAGSNRYETAVKVAEMLDTSNGIFVCIGEDFPDALSVSPVAAQKGMPILLVAKDAVPDSVKQFLAGKNIPVTYVMGGNDVINSNIAAQFPNAKIINGSDIYERNVNLINELADTINFDNVYIASGSNFPDALSGSALAAKSSSPILLVNKIPKQSSIDLLKSKPVINLNILGGTGVIPDITLGYLNGTIPLPTDTAQNQK